MHHARNPGKPLFRLGIKLIRLVFILALAFALLAIFTTQPSFVRHPPTEQTVDPARLRVHVETLADDYAPRNYRQVYDLDASAVYITEEFKQAGARVSEQSFTVQDRIYRNIVASFGPETGSKIVVGAHYDACGDTPGADDNASGVAGLIELAYLLGRLDLKQSIELVAYALEEPPFFATGNMGSARHAAGLRQGNIEVKAMICLEMIGYYSDEEGSQHFPSSFLKMLYPDRGNYIAVIGSYSDRKLLREVKASMRGATDLPVEAMCAPKTFPGIDFSDHRNYWKNGYTAVMITDTAFFRNGNYHRDSDTPDTLDYERMSMVVLGVYEAVDRLANEGN